MTKFRRLIAIRKLSTKDPRWIHKDVFRVLRKNELWQMAYENLKGNKGCGATRPIGSEPGTMNQMSLQQLGKLREQVCTEQYKFKPVKLTHKPSCSFGTRVKTRPDERLELGLPTAHLVQVFPLGQPLGADELEPSETQNALPSFGRERGSPRAPMSINNDMIVEEVIRIILETIYEPVFYPTSFGFGARMGCHDALAHVEKTFRWVDWVIVSTSVSSKHNVAAQPNSLVYSTIDHKVLVRILEKRIDDTRFINLIRKLLKSGATIKVVVSNKQESVVSPILANIYYHELDEYVQELAQKYTTPQTRLKNVAYKRLQYAIAKTSKKMWTLEHQSHEYQTLKKQLKTLRNKLLETPGRREKVIRVEYVRYAEDWMVGIAGNGQLASLIKEELRIRFAEANLLQTLHSDPKANNQLIGTWGKTKLTDLRQGNVHFLGYDIFLPRNQSISQYKRKGVTTIRKRQPRLKFDVPVKKLTQRYIDRGYLKRLATNVRPISKASYTTLEDHVIVNHFGSLWLGIQNYYSGCTNLGRLQYIHYLLHMSCAMTLAHRHRVSSAKIFRKYGKHLQVPIPNTKKTTKFPYRTTWRLNDRRWLRGRNAFGSSV